MPSAAAGQKPTKVKTHVATISMGESLVTVRKGNRAVLAALGPKIIASMRRRKHKTSVEKASEGLRAIREGR